MSKSKLDPKYFFEDGSKRPDPYRDEKNNLLNEEDWVKSWQWAKEQHRLWLESLSEEELKKFQEETARFQRKMQSSGL